MAAKSPRPAGGASSEGRVKSLVLLRLLLAGAGIASLGIFEHGYSRDIPPLQTPFFPLLAVAFAVNFIYLILIRIEVDPRRLILAQLIIDVLIVSGLVYVAGPTRAYTYVYFAIVIAGALLVSMRSGIGLATLSSILLTATTVLYYSSARWAFRLPYILPSRQEGLDLKIDFPPIVLAFFVLSLYVVAWLAGKLAEELSRVRILNEEILHNMAGGVIAVDRTGAIAFLNPQAMMMLGIREPSGRLVGAPSEKILPREMADLMKRGMSGGEPVEQEIRVGDMPIEVSISHLTDGRNGPLRGAVAILNDLSLRNQMEQMEQRAERFQALLEMSAGIAHEIRNPLASIRGAVQELQSTQFQSEDDKTLLRVIIRESDRLNKIITDFLEYATERPMEFSLVNLAELLREVSVLLEAREESHLKIKLEVPRQVVCRGSPDKLKQVFLNLGLNAIEACTEGGQLTIRCLPAQAPNGQMREGVLIEFEDNGPGISKEDLKKVFTPFFTTKPRGTGMGLAIARKMVQAHEGFISIESQEKKGTAARVWLPAS